MITAEDKYIKSNPAPWSNFDRRAATLQEIDRISGRPVVFLDFEFNGVAEPVLNLVSCSLIGSRPGILQQLEAVGETREFWLDNDAEAHGVLADLLEDMRAEGVILVAYAVAAEARSLLSLGLDPHCFDWVDLFADWRQLTFNNYSCQYGTYFTKNGYRRESIPPGYSKEWNKGKDNKEVGLGLVDCIGQLFGVWVDSLHKKDVRDLIISAPEAFSKSEQKTITTYCTSDILPLPFIYTAQEKRLKKATGMTSAQVLNARLARGRFMVSVAKMETSGFPLNLEAAYNLRNNFKQAREDIIRDLVTNYYPFYEREPVGPKTKGILGDWVEKYDAFVKFLHDNHPDLVKAWPLTDTGRLSREDKVLEEFSGIPEIAAFRAAKKNITQLAWFKEPDAKKKEESGDFFDSVGSDGHLRTFLGAYGTQTSRNAPKASRFILAMSNWLRCLIHPPPGFSIIAIDYASQEFAIAAILSEDRNMIAAYRSGDPYLFFAKKAGAVPANAEPQKCKNPNLVLLEKARELNPGLDDRSFLNHPVASDMAGKLEDFFPEVWHEFKIYQEYERQRNLFKATTLGLQYGMGAEKLAAKLSADTGEKVTLQQAQKLIKLHRRTYPIYWSWLSKKNNQYDRAGCLILRDGWALLGDNDNSLSVRNFPVQGTGAVIMREAVRLAHERGLNILSPLHDALYMMSRADTAKDSAKELADCMLKAVTNILGNTLEIRLDTEIHEHGEPWIEGKGRKYYKMLSKYLKKIDTKKDKTNKLRQTIFSS